MKKIMFVISAGLICFCTSCNNKDNGGEKNLEATHGVNKAIETGDVSKLGDYIATDAVDHADPMKGDIKGLDSIKANLAKIHSMISDMKMETVKELADGDYVFQWLRFTGISKTAEMGMPPGTKFDMTAIEVSKFKDGKAIEHWEFMQAADMMKMMPQPGTDKGMDMNKMDTTMKK